MQGTLQGGALLKEVMKDKRVSSHIVQRRAPSGAGENAGVKGTWPFDLIPPFLSDHENESPHALSLV